MCTLKMLPWCRSNQLHTRRPCMSVNALEVRHLKSEAHHQDTRKRLVRPASSHTELNSVSDRKPSRYEMAGAFYPRRVFCSGRALTKLPKMTRSVYRCYEQLHAADALLLLSQEANNASDNALQNRPAEVRKRTFGVIYTLPRVGQMYFQT